MADFFRGLAGGFGTGLQFGQALRERQLREALAEEAAKYTPTEGAYGPELGQNIEQLRGLQTQNPEIADQYEPAIAELQRRQAMTAPDYTIGSMALHPEDTYATRAEAVRAAAPMRAEGLANVYRQFGDIERADAAETRAQQARAAGLTIGKMEREEKKAVDFDTGLANIYKQEFEKPEARTAAILDLVEKTQGPTARAQLEASYSQNELNRINLDAAKFQKGFQQAFTKGVDATMSWLDEQNPGFTLERQGKQIFQVTADGTRRVFAQGDDNQIMEQFAGMATPANFLTLSKNVVDREMKQRELELRDKQLGITRDYYQGILNRAPKPSAAESLTDQAKGLVKDGVYKDVPTAIEALKKGVVRDRDADAWLRAEQELMKNGAAPEDILLQRDQFFARRGYAPGLLQQVILSGIDPTTNKPLTMKQVEDFNKKYPQSAISPADLPWMQRERTRQGLIEQIPR